MQLVLCVTLCVTLCGTLHPTQGDKNYNQGELVYYICNTYVYLYECNTYECTCICMYVYVRSVTTQEE